MQSFRSDIPKPLVPVAGRALIDRALDRLAEAGVRRVVVNVSHQAELLMRHLAARQGAGEQPEIVISPEEAPLETGGGLLKALPLLGGEAPILVVNSDICWLDEGTPALRRLVEAYDERRMDALLLTCPLARTTGYGGAGDFILAEDGRLRRRRSEAQGAEAQEAQEQSEVFTGIQLLHPRALAPWREAMEAEAEFPVFSLNRLFVSHHPEGWLDRICGLSHRGWWCHVGDGDGVMAAEKLLAERACA